VPEWDRLSVCLPDLSLPNGGVCNPERRMDLLLSTHLFTTHDLNPLRHLKLTTLLQHFHIDASRVSPN
jgi:hypothetical protein